MELVHAVDIIISCIGYTIGQVETSNIDIMGLKAIGNDEEEAKRTTLKMLAEVYKQLDDLTYTNPYYGLTRRHLNELLSIDEEI